jgi:ArsR family metal-binding transcriptional regulator
VSKALKAIGNFIISVHRDGRESLKLIKNRDTHYEAAASISQIYLQVKKVVWVEITEHYFFQNI